MRSVDVAPSFMTRPQAASASLLALLVAGAALVSAQSAVAGPAVGTVLGAPTATSTTVNARVVSSTPVVAQVAVPRDVCYDEIQAQGPRTAGAGALIGAVAGAAVGNAVGKGSGRAVATGVGLIGGAILGHHIENQGRPQETHTVRRCEQQSSYENQVVAYSVVYEINGQRYTTQLPHEPGATIPVDMTVSPVTSSPRASYPAPVVVAPTVVQPVVQRVNYVTTVAPAPVWVVKQGRHHPRHHEHPGVGLRVAPQVAYNHPGRYSRWDR